MTAARTTLTSAAVAAALLLAGCGAVKDPYASAPRAPAASGTTTTQDQRVDPGTEAPDDLVAAAPLPLAAPPARPAASPGLAARRYATRYVNWTWRTYAKQQRQLIALATGKLRADLRRSAPGSDQLGVLDAQKQTNRGRVISLGARVDARAAGEKRELFVVTLEQAGSGNFADPNQRHGAYKATVARAAGGWRVSAWTALP